jgi:CRISPR-associated protein Csx14
MNISIPLDPSNPGQVYACFGLIELFDLQNNRTHSRFKISDQRPRRGCFEIRSDLQLDMSTLLGGLKAASVEYLDHAEKAVQPVRLTLANSEILLDWWFDCFRAKTVSLKCWAGQVTTEKLMKELILAINPATDSEHLLQVSCMMKTRFGIDPRSAWNALDMGYSPNEHNQDAATYPLVELLGAIGLQGFRPNSDTRSSVSYNLWRDWLPRVPARRAATIAWPGLSCDRYQFSIEKRGQSYKFFTFAAPAERKNDH